MSRSVTRTALQPLISRSSAASSSRSARTVGIPTRNASTYPGTPSWPSKTHLRKPPSVPAPLPALYAKQVILSDGSTFTAHITSPSPANIRLTRDVTNNPLWAPGTEKAGLGADAEEGRVGRFRRRFEGLSMGGPEGVEEEDGGKGKGKGTGAARAFAEGDLDWMSEGAVEENIGSKAATGKGKK